MDFQKWVESLGSVFADLTPDQTAALQVAYDEVAEAETVPAPRLPRPRPSPPLP